MAKKREVILPGLPSALIRLALKDLQEVERSKKFVVDMCIWHEPIKRDGEAYTNEKRKQAKPNAKCVVCFAGSVMARSLRIPDTQEIGSPRDWLQPNAGRLDALNDFRTGNISAGLQTMGYTSSFIETILEDTETDLDTNVDVPAYEKYPTLFKRAMAKMAKNFEAIGL